MYTASKNPTVFCDGRIFHLNTLRLPCKPGSVWYGHLSRHVVTDAFKRYSRSPSSEPLIRRQSNLAPNGVYTARFVTETSVSSYLPFPSLQIALRSVSVALSLESPPPDVIRRPALWCPDFPHGKFTTQPYGQLKIYYSLYN